MKQVIKEFIPTDVSNATYDRNGRITGYYTADERVIYIGHEEVEVTECAEGAHHPEAMQGRAMRTTHKTIAFKFRVPKFVTRARAITAAEMAAYGLHTPLDVASFNAGLSRKYREGVDMQEVQDHDEFIAWVKAELTKLGI